MIQGLKHDLLADDQELRDLIPQRLLTFDDAVRVTLADENKLAKGLPAHPMPEVGDTVDSWKVIILEPEKELALLFGMKASGLGRLTFTLRDEGDKRSLDVCAFWHPHLFYWLVMIPAHLFIFRGMARRI